MEKRADSERYKGLQPVKKGSIEAVEKGRKGGLAKRGSVSLVKALKRTLRGNPGQAEELAKKWLDNALEDPQYAKMIVEQIDGKPLQKVEQTNIDRVDEIKVTIEPPPKDAT